MATYTVKATGGNYTSLNGLLGAIATGAISDSPGHEAVLYTIGSEPTSYTFTGSGAGASRVNPITIRVATPAQNGGPALDLQVTKAITLTNVPSVRFDLRDSGQSRLRFRGFITLAGGCHGFELLGDTGVNTGLLDGQAGWSSGGQSGLWDGNLFVQYGMVTRRINDELIIDGVKFVHRRKSASSGVRGYTVNGDSGVTCLKIDSSYQSAQSRPSDGIQILNSEFARYANDGIQVLGMMNSLIEDCWFHDLYPTEAGNNEHIDGIHVMQAYNSTINRVKIERVLYQGLWLKTDNSTAVFTGDTTGQYNSLNGLVASNVTCRTFGGAYLGSAEEFNGDLTYVESGVTKTYGATGGTGIGITNARKVLLAHCVAVEQFNGAGLEVNFTQNTTAQPYRPRNTSAAASTTNTWLLSASDMDVDIVNCVFSWAACDRSAGKLSVDPKSLGTWRNNLQTTVKASTGNYEVVTTAGTGDLAIGTNPNWTTAFVPLTGSPLLDAGYNSTLTTGLALPAADYAGTTWGTRNIGAFETAGATAPLNADAGPDTGGAEDVDIQLDGTATTSPGTTTYSWSKVSGPGTVTFSPSSTVAAPNAVFSDPGTYVVRLTASTTESPGTTDTDDVTVVVTTTPGPPVLAVAGLVGGSKVFSRDGIAYVSLT